MSHHLISGQSLIDQNQSVDETCQQPIGYCSATSSKPFQLVCDQNLSYLVLCACSKDWLQLILIKDHRTTLLWPLLNLTPTSATSLRLQFFKWWRGCAMVESSVRLGLKRGNTIWQYVVAKDTYPLSDKWLVDYFWEWHEVCKNSLKHLLISLSSCWLNL